MTEMEMVLQELKKITEDIHELKGDVKSVKISLENDVSPSIKMLSELQLENSKRLIRLERDVQEITDNIAIDEVINNLKMN